MIDQVLEKEYFKILHNVRSFFINKRHMENNPKTRELGEILSSIYQPIKKLENSLIILLT
ncbi:hypothetical protein HYE11_00940 [Mycoplasmopsis bovis]|nr:hypothetical protein HYE11_00940 [Mycoplasmopsis bovis]